MSLPGGTRIEVAAHPARVRTVLQGGVLRPRLLSAGAREARVAVVPTGALLLGGDAVAIDVVVGPGARLELVETAGTVAYPGPPATWQVRARLGQGAVLVWEGLPFVVCDGAVVRRSTSIDLADGACAVVRDTVVLGRAGERGGRLRQTNRVRLGGSALLAEDLDLDPDLRRAPGVLGGHRVIDTVAAFGFRPSVLGAGGGGAGVRLDLAGPGALQRFIGTEAHVSPLARDAVAWWEQVERQDHGNRPTRVDEPIPA